MHMAHKFRHLSINFDEPLTEINRMRCGVTHAIDPLHRRHIADEIGKIHMTSIMTNSPVRINVLSELCDFSGPTAPEFENFGNNIIKRPAKFLTTCVGDNTKAAVLAATFHNRHKRPRSFDTRQWQTVKLFNLWETDIDTRFPLGQYLII